MLNQNINLAQSISKEQISQQNQAQKNSKIPLIIRIANSSNNSTPVKLGSFQDLSNNEVINLCEQENIKQEINDFKPKKQIDCIVLQNELNYFEDEKEEFKNDKKLPQKPQRTSYISQQHKTIAQEQYYNPIILADNTKHRERQIQNQRNQQRNNSLENKFIEKSNNQLISNRNHIRQQNCNNASFNLIKIDSSQQLDIENIQNSSSDSCPEVYQKNKLTNINQQLDFKQKKDLLQISNLNTIQKEQSIVQSQNLNRNIKIKNQTPLLPPIHPQKLKQAHQQTNHDLNKNEIKTDFIRKSRSNSFTEEKNIFKMNLDKSQRVSSSEFKNLLNNVNFQQIQKNLSRNQKSKTQTSEQNYNVIDDNSTNGVIKKYHQKHQNDINQCAFDRAQYNQNIRQEQQNSLFIQRYQIPLIISQPELEFIQERSNNIKNYPNQVRQQVNSQEQPINNGNMQQNLENIREINERQKSKDVIRLQNQNVRTQQQQQQRNNNNNEQTYNDIIQRRNQINAQQENLNDQFQSRQNTINQNPPPRFMIDNMYNQFIEFQNQLRQHQGIKSDKYVSTTVYKSSQSQNLSQDAKQCSICLCEFEDEEKISFLACFHRFHNECIHKWFETKSTCPLCKKDQKTLIKDVNKLLDEF
ncbi:kinase domain protein (macronuclear) [Tetrahymena thermophila SB210]|uniref:Kinase domain protein n=1 Tax=Tetrahymena thermophila (strain SB210) TaxID=312017 RepID=I7LTA9_TETTS|nr:kinase domain protein [Tetrahymena thermophila SB210]EAR84914.4 kinase domain protein [Tetrahymena thermophila SB210]|eukprot:XP_001032577.4 kinase domain protein [Tetrahymena thermophila SB210]